MKKKPRWLTRLLTAALGLVAFWLLLSAPLTLKINNLHGLIKSTISKEIKATDNDDAKEAWQLAKSTGADDLLLQNVPRKFSYQSSYLAALQLSQESGKAANQAQHGLVAALGQAGLSRRQARQLLALLPKAQIKKVEMQVNEALHKYQTCFWIVSAIACLSLVLIFVGHGLGIWLLNLLNLFLLVLLMLIASNSQESLQANLASDLQVTVAASAYAGMLLGLLGLVVWHLGKKRARRHG